MAKNHKTLSLTIPVSSLNDSSEASLYGSSSRYTYEFEGQGGNWPVIVTPVSGTIIGTDDVKLDVNVYFCEDLETCAATRSDLVGLMPYNTGLYEKGSSLYTSLQIIVKNADSNKVCMTSTNLIKCDDCLPTLAISNTSSDITFDASTTNKQQISHTIDNLKPESSYIYEYISVDGNWPVTITPISGTFTTTKDNYRLESTALFCETSTSCNSNDNLLANFALESYAEYNKYHNIRLSVKSVSDDSDIVTSELIQLKCVDCTSGGPSVSVNNTLSVDVSNLSYLDVALSQLDATKKYAYEFTNQESNWPIVISSMSGNISGVSSYNLKEEVYFCPTTGCDDLNNKLSFNLPDLSLDYKREGQASFRIYSVDSNGDSDGIHDTTTPLISFVCNNCLPNPKITAPTSINLAAKDSTDVSILFSDLIVGNQYYYNFSNEYSDWPTLIYPMSGYFVANKPSHELTSKVVFCSASGYCADSDYLLTPYNTIAETAIIQDKNSRFNVSLRNVDGYGTITSPTISAQCEDCLKSASLVSNSTSTNRKLSVSDTTEDMFTAINLVPNTFYEYVVSAVDSNWPLIVTEFSGQFKATASTYDIPYSLQFCRSTGVCLADGDNVIVATEAVDQDWIIDQTVVVNPKATIKMSLDSMTYDMDPVDSKLITYDCDDCLKVPKFSKSGNDTETLSQLHHNNLSFTVRNLIPGETYIYVLDTVENNWPIVIENHSGSFKAANSTQVIESLFTFCPTSGLCSDASDPSIKQISYDDNSCFVFDTDQKYASFNLTLDPTSYGEHNFVSENYMLVCDNCLPDPTPTINALSIIGEDNKSDISLNFGKLITGDEYYYELQNDTSVTDTRYGFSKTSGYFTPTANTHEIVTEIEFCSDVLDTECSGNAINPHSVVDIYNGKAGFLVYLESQACSISGFSDVHTTVCDHCLPQVDVSILPNSYSLTSENKFFLSLKLDNLVEDKAYTIAMSRTDSNWPVVFGTGDMLAFTATAPTKTINIPGYFAIGTGVADVITPPIKVINPATDFDIYQSRKYIDLNITASIDDNSELDKTLEYKMNACVDCMPKTLLTHVSTAEDKNTFISTFRASNLVLGETYNLNFANVSGVSNWPYVLDTGNISSIIADSITKTIVVEGHFLPSTGSVNIGNAINQQDLFGLDATKKAEYELSLVSANELQITSDSIASSTDCVDCNQYFDVETSISHRGTESATNEFVLSFELTDLSLGDDYTISIKENGSNWPVVLSSGGLLNFTALDKTKVIDIPGEFLATTGSYGIDEGLSVSSGANFDGYSTVKKLAMEITTSGNLDVLNNVQDHNIFCNNCLPKIAMTATNKDFVLNSNGTEGNIKYPITIKFDNLIVGQQYQTSITDIDSNWFYNISSGTNNVFTAVTASQEFNWDVSYCPTSGGTCAASSFNSSLTPDATCDSMGIKFNVALSPIENLNENEIISVSGDFVAECVDCLPYLEAKLDYNNVQSTVNNATQTVTTVFNGLVCGNTYEYEYVSNTGTWPARFINSLSGSFVPESDTYTLTNDIAFCPGTGSSLPCVASDELLSWATPTESCDLVDDSMRAKFHVSFSGLNIDREIIKSSNADIHCDNCLDKIEVINPSNNILVNNNSDTLKFTVNGLIAGSPYDYNINISGANWPANVSAQSGTFIADDSSHSLETLVNFCYPSGNCDAADDDFISYTLYTELDKQLYGELYNMDMSLTVGPTGTPATDPNGDTTCGQISVTGSVFKPTCQECFPTYSYASVSISGAPIMNMPVGCCTGVKALHVNVYGAIPGEEYTYDLTNPSGVDGISPIQFAPSSGSIYFDANGEGTVISTMNSDLENFEQTVVQFSMTHTKSNQTAIDMMAVNCGGDCFSYYEELNG